MADGVIRGVLERWIDELPDELRIVFVACVVDGMTPGQFAELLALTPGRAPSTTRLQLNQESSFTSTLGGWLVTAQDHPTQRLSRVDRSMSACGTLQT